MLHLGNDIQRQVGCEACASAEAGRETELWLISLLGTQPLPTVVAAQPYWLPCHGLPLLM